MIAFWVLAPDHGRLRRSAWSLARKAVHSALLLAVVMVSLAVLYAAQDAPFLFAVQIIVYTGAVLMLFLFVLMLVGVDSGDSLVETIRGQRLAAVVLGVVFAVLLIAGVTQTTLRRCGRARRGEHRRQRSRRRAAPVQQLRLRVRGDERPAHHGRAGRDGARPPRAADVRSRPSATWCSSGCATTPSRASTRAAAEPRLVRPAQLRRHTCPASRRHAVGAVDLARDAGSWHRPRRRRRHGRRRPRSRRDDQDDRGGDRR